jgi:hypothetical protein
MYISTLKSRGLERKLNPFLSISHFDTEEYCRSEATTKMHASFDENSA